MQIKIDGLDSLIRKLNAYKDSLNEKQTIFLERLSKIGVDTAKVKFSTAQYDGDKEDIYVKPVWEDENTIVINASGKSVVFIEFGSGSIGGGHEWGEKTGFVPGSWSDSEQGKGHWKDPGWWYYEHGKISHGNEPARAMYEASKAMRQEIIKIAQEVFCGD